MKFMTDKIKEFEYYENIVRLYLTGERMGVVEMIKKLDRSNQINFWTWFKDGVKNGEYNYDLGFHLFYLFENWRE